MNEPDAIEPADTTIQVRIVSISGQSALVEFQGEISLERRYVPVNQLDRRDGDAALCRQDTLDLGIVYGIPWADKLDLSILTPAYLQAELRRRGVWTEGDLRLHDNVVTRIAVNSLGRIIFECIK